MKKATNNKKGCKMLISALKEQDGTIKTNRDRIFERYTEFYEHLYNYMARDIVKVQAKAVPPISNQ